MKGKISWLPTSSRTSSKKSLSKGSHVGPLRLQEKKGGLGKRGGLGQRHRGGEERDRRQKRPESLIPLHLLTQKSSEQ